MKKMKRVVILVIDGLGAGWQDDAGKYGDKGADTFGHVFETQHPDLPNLQDLGLLAATGYQNVEEEAPLGCYGLMHENAAGKDTTTGHWEIAGLTLKKPFPTYPHGFPPEVIEAFERETGFQVIGNKPASGTAIIEELGPEHLRTGKLIVYTSADSVFQIAAHESIIPPTELWHICRIARRLLVGEHAVGRVIARPFEGEPGSFVRTGNRRDFSLDPTGDTLLDVLKEENFDVLGVGKIEDIFNHRGLTKSDHAIGNEACLQSTIDFLKKPNWKGLLFTNLVDTDSKCGHRRDPEAYAQALEAIDRRLPEVLRYLGEDGMLMVCADHGCDPTFTGSDHTREKVPLLVYGLGLQEGVNLGLRKTFADVSATALEALGAKARLDGTSFYRDVVLED